MTARTDPAVAAWLREVSAAWAVHTTPNGADPDDAEHAVVLAHVADNAEHAVVLAHVADNPGLGAYIALTGAGPVALAAAEHLVSEHAELMRLRRLREVLTAALDQPAHDFALTAARALENLDAEEGDGADG